MPKLKETTLHQNPFWILGATARDNRRRIVELAEQKSLERDHDLCQKARSNLTGPRTRLTAEVAWLPGVSPKKAELLVGQLLLDPTSLRSESRLPALAQANLMAAAFESTDAKEDTSYIANHIREFVDLVDHVSPEVVLRDVNEDRAVSGFPEINSLDQVEAEVAERKRYYRNAIRNALDRLPSRKLVDVMMQLVTETTDGGKKHAPELIESLVDTYEVEAQEFLHKESENIQKLITTARNSVKINEKSIGPLIDKLEDVTRNWSKIANPIQISARARGIRHAPSVDLGFAIRSLGIDLFNEYKLVEQSRRITGLLQEFFADLPELIERVEEDASSLEEITQAIKQSESEKKEWEREITYAAEVGALFKSNLSIGPSGVCWQNRTFPLEAVTRIRWGGVRHSVNGIPTGTSYTVGFGDERLEAVVELRRAEIYSTFVDKLWRAVGVRLLVELLQAFKSGKQFRFGSAIIKDDGVILPIHKFWSSGDQVQCAWHEVHVWTADGSFYIGARENKKAYAAFPYIEMANVHVLEHAIRIAFKKPGMRALSDVLAG